MPNTRLVPPDFWSSTRSGLDTDAIQDGLIEQYAHNKSLKRAVPIRKGAVQEDGGPGGSFKRIMAGRARFIEARMAEMKRGEVQQENIEEFVDRKIWSV